MRLSTHRDSIPIEDSSLFWRIQLGSQFLGSLWWHEYRLLVYGSDSGLACRRVSGEQAHYATKAGNTDRVCSMDVVVQPSVPWMNLNDQIKDSGLFFPVDPGPSVRMHTLLHYLPSAPVIPIGQSERMLMNMSGSNWRHGGDELQVIKYFL